MGCGASAKKYKGEAPAAGATAEAKATDAATPEANGAKAIKESEPSASKAEPKTAPAPEADQVVAPPVPAVPENLDAEPAQKAEEVVEEVTADREIPIEQAVEAMPGQPIPETEQPAVESEVPIEQKPDEAPAPPPEAEPIVAEADPEAPAAESVPEPEPVALVSSQKE
mmetsp:Transcript_14615/g.31980  ORF Transcript_14615/g.31980 Transcript_14615/m.31980 type:complete len:169 (-) Transcript_14615:238-744(-)